MYDQTLPQCANRFLFNELDHIDFQSVEEQSEAEYNDETAELDSNDFKPQKEFDDSNKYFALSRFVDRKIQKTPLASMRLCELTINEEGGEKTETIKDETLYFYGQAQMDLAYSAEEQSKLIQQGKEEQSNMRRYYRSSTPLELVIEYLNKNWKQVGAVLPQTVKD